MSDGYKCPEREKEPGWEMPDLMDDISRREEGDAAEVYTLLKRGTSHNSISQQRKGFANSDTRRVVSAPTHKYTTLFPNIPNIPPSFLKCLVERQE